MINDARIRQGASCLNWTGNSGVIVRLSRTRYRLHLEKKCRIFAFLPQNRIQWSQNRQRTHFQLNNPTEKLAKTPSEKWCDVISNSVLQPSGYPSYGITVYYTLPPWKNLICLSFLFGATTWGFECMHVRIQEFAEYCYLPFHSI